MKNKPFQIPEEKIKEIDFQLVQCGQLEISSLTTDEHEEYKVWLKKNKKKKR